MHKINKIRIATRSSNLALAQTNEIKNKLLSFYPHLKIQILPMKTKGDIFLNTSLSKIGRKGLFTKELENALIEENADIAVHSMKDMPHTLNDDLAIGAFVCRADPSDCFINFNNTTIRDMPKNSIIGTSSLRRSYQLKKLYPHLVVKDLRGNLQTRLKKLENNLFDGIILATAGLNRLAHESFITEKFNVEEFIPAIGQGCIGIEYLKKNEEIFELLSPLNHYPTEQCIKSERIISKIFNGNCQIPIGAYAHIKNYKLYLHAFIGCLNTQKIISGKIDGDVEFAEQLGEKLAYQLIEKGAIPIKSD